MKNFSNGTNSRSQDSLTNRSSSQQQNRVLCLGDSIIKGVNPKGLKSGIHKNSRNGGNIQTMKEEVRLYDLKAFSAVIVYAGGNNVASGETIEFIEEKYDELISLIKCGNSTAVVYLCSVAPRNDADVLSINCCITVLCNHWKSQQVDTLSDCHDFFYKDGHVESRYILQNGIHLSFSGTKRLLDAINRVFPVVDDFDHYTFSRTGTGNLQGNGQFRRGQRLSGFRMQGNNGSRTMLKGQKRVRCFGCFKFGHKFADCWYAKQGLGITATQIVSAPVSNRLFFNLNNVCAECNMIC